MKTPRVHDFDPNAQVPELGSPMDNLPAIQKPEVKTNLDSKPGSLPGVSTVHPVRPVLPVPPKRVMKPRHPFDIYQDQYEGLRDLAAEERKQGGVGSMSAMVREAIDTFIIARKKK